MLKKKIPVGCFGEKCLWEDKTGNKEMSRGSCLVQKGTGDGLD